MIAAALVSSSVNSQEAATSAESLEQQLQRQMATNAALRERIEKLEAALKTDVCVDPSAAQALLDDRVAPSGAAAASAKPVP